MISVSFYLECACMDNSDEPAFNLLSYLQSILIISMYCLSGCDKYIYL